MTKIACLGIGMMGAPMAANLIAAGFHVTAWNRTRAKASAISGAIIAQTPKDAVASADVIISVLTDGAATLDIQSQPTVRAALQPHQVWIEMASVKPAQARAQAIDLATLGVAHLDAPVSGGTTGAQAATLAIMVGGDQPTFARANPVLSALGNPVHVGPSGTGQLAKLANQGIVGITIGAVAEAKGLGLSLPLSSDIQARFKSLCDEMGHGDLDQAALYLELLARNQSS